jgi:hypothetical protein
MFGQVCKLRDGVRQRAAVEMRASAHLSCALLGLVITSIGCGSKAPAVTGLIVTIETTGFTADQFEITVATPDGPALPPTRRPESPGGALTSPQTVSIFLPDALAGQPATCTVTPFSSGAQAAPPASGTATLVVNQLVPVTIELGTGPVDGAAGATADAGKGGGGGAGAAGNADAGGGAGGGAGAGGTSAGGGQPGRDAATDGPKPLGQPCAGGAECDSTLCVDGVCCGSACGTLCQSCNVPGSEGTCTPIPAGKAPAAGAAQRCAGQPAVTCGFDGTCDGNGGCRRFPAGTQCQSPSCSGATYVPGAACDGRGTCMAPVAIGCAPYNCGTVNGSLTCLSTCTSGGNECVQTASCVNGSCGARPPQSNGAGCMANSECTSNFCVDGVCCENACAGACNSCNQTGKEGMCLAVAANAPDPRKICVDGGSATCGKNGLCDGSGNCAIYPATTMCAAASCNGRSTLQPARFCDGKGVCAAAATVNCMAYRCDPVTTTCFKSCTSSGGQCSQGYSCSGSMVCRNNN